MTQADLLLIHQPYGRYMEAWPVMEKLTEEGILKNIGVSNFSEKKMKELLSVAKVKPAVNQIEMHPYFLHKTLAEYLRKKDILPMAWGSLFEGLGEIFENPELKKIGDKYQKNVAQVILRWHLENGIPALFKSESIEHINQDVDIYDFSLTEEDKKIISSLDVGFSQIIDHDSPQTEKWLTEWKIHDEWELAS